MIERITPEQYEQRQISDITAPEAWLDKELKEQAEERAYIYGDPPEEEPKNEKPLVQQFFIGQAANSNSSIPWGLIGIITIAGLITLGIVAIVAVKK